MPRYALHWLIALALVLALGVGTTAPAWAVPVVPVPGHHFAIAVPPTDPAECHDGSCEACDDAHHDATVTHADCVICLGLALPVGVLEPVRELPAGFEIGRQTDGAGVQSDLDPHPPRSLSHRI